VRRYILSVVDRAIGDQLVFIRVCHSISMRGMLFVLAMIVVSYIAVSWCVDTSMLSGGTGHTRQVPSRPVSSSKNMPNSAFSKYLPPAQGSIDVCSIQLLNSAWN
jgi:hypothetical protein